jgi:hypothetical protein
VHGAYHTGNCKCLSFTLSGLQCFLTYLPEELCSSQSSRSWCTYRRFLGDIYTLLIDNNHLSMTMWILILKLRLRVINQKSLTNTKHTLFSVVGGQVWAPEPSPSSPGVLCCHASEIKVKVPPKIEPGPRSVCAFAYSIVMPKHGMTIPGDGKSRNKVVTVTMLPLQQQSKVMTAVKFCVTTESR